MKSFKFIFSSLFCLCCMFLNAQTDYKGVYLDRDKEDVTQAVVTNTNDYPVEILFQYKVGSRDTEWRNYSYEYIRIEAHKKQKFSVASKIYGLNLIYVDILKPSVGEQILDAVGAFGSGYQKAKEEKAAKEADQNNY